VTLNFRQLIRPGQSGSDVKAVKLAYRRMGIQGAGAMQLNKRAGPAFVHTTKAFQKNHGLKVDGIYGKSTHEKLVRMRRDDKAAFSSWAAMLYRTAAIRQPKVPPVTDMTAAQAAKYLLNSSKYHSDNYGDHLDLVRTSQGLAVWSQAGRWVHIDKRVLQALVFIIEKGYSIGTFALCSDHHYDGPHGHSGGHSVDISSINGTSVSSSAARTHTLELAKLIRYGMPATLKPWQQICDGYGYMHSSEISACTVPGSWFYGYTVMREHRNHIHLGYYGS
jgi:peptidoglycan hydrolase-like protein with peptidoglycan-binding domain